MNLNTVWSLHDIRDVEKLTRAAINKALQSMQARLGPEDYDDLLQDMVIKVWQWSEEWTDYQRDDSTRNRKKPIPFKDYVHTHVQLRTIDWYRARFYRDQTSTSWYRRRNPNATPPTEQERQRRRQFHSPDSLDKDSHNNVEQGSRQQQHAAPDHSERDSLAFALRASTGDPSIDCDPALANALRRRPGQEVRHIHLPRPAAHDRAA